MKAAVLVFPGSNCDRDLAVAIEKICGTKPLMVWHQESELPDDLDLIAVPGGFSYGDYLRSGAMAARSAVMPAVIKQAERGVPVLGICNGFQILTEAGLLPGALMRNAGLSFICRNVGLEIQNTTSPFTRLYKKNQKIHLPVAHHDGIIPRMRRLWISWKTKIGWHCAIPKASMVLPVILPVFLTRKAMFLA